MSTLPDITEALCLAIARREEPLRIKALCLQAAAKMSERTPERSSKIQRAFEWSEQQKPTVQTLSPLLSFNSVPSKHWDLVRPETRSPWLPNSVKTQIERWSMEQANAEALLSAGEKVMPLLLVGETGCGKTSTALALAQSKPLYRLSLARATDSRLGETGKLLEKAIHECHAQAFWLVDEIDAIAVSRTGGSAAAKDQNHSIGCLLTALDNMNPSISLIATSNVDDILDAAVCRRFTIIKWPSWDDLSIEEATHFFVSHGGDKSSLEIYFPSCYASAIKLAREQRISKLLQR